MRLSSFRTVRIAPGLAVPLVTLLLACGEAPTDPTGLTEGLPVAAGHVSGGESHGKVTVTIIQQPVIDANPGNEDCRIHYGFEIRVKGKEILVTHRVYWWGGGHGGTQIGGPAVWSVGARTGPVAVHPVAGHADDGHSFEALRIVLTDEAGDVVAQADTEGRTVSCS
jgi:hypothetical protein